MRQRAAVLVCVGILVACSGARDEWEPGAVRAVARHVATQHPEATIVVGNTAGDAGAELPWGVRQSLTTGGFAVGDTAAPGGDRAKLLVFTRSARSGDAWLIDTRLEDRSAPGSRLAQQWQVRCPTVDCEVELVQ